MYLSHPQNRNNRTPAFTVDGIYSFLTGHFLGETEHLYNCPGDLDGDRYVGSRDLDIIRGNWLKDTLAGEYLRGDCFSRRPRQQHGPGYPPHPLGRTLDHSRS